MTLVGRAIEIYRREGLRNLLTATARFLWTKAVGTSLSVLYGLPPVDRYAFAVSVRRLRSRMDRERGVDDVLETAYHYTGVGFYHSITPVQHPGELGEVAATVADLDPDVVVEIGTGRGGSTYVWTRCTDASTVVSVDVDFSWLGVSPLRYRNRPRFMRSFAEETDLRFIEADSRREDTVELVREAIDGRAIDFLFIDGDHSYEGVKRDFELYRPLVADGGLIALHDTRDDQTGVPSFWGELADEYETEEIHLRTEHRSLPHLRPELQERLRERGGIGLVHA